MGIGRPEVTSDRRGSHENDPKPEGFGAGARVSPLTQLVLGPFVIDPEAGRLLEGDQVIPLAPKPFETLLYLAQRPGRVVSKSELMEHLWPETFVTDDVLVQSIVEIRRALRDHARTPEYVETIPRRGYRFIHEVRPAAPLAADGHAAASAGPARSGLASPALPETAAEATGRIPARDLPAWLRTGIVMATLVLLSAALVFVLVRGWRRSVAEGFTPEPGALVVMPVLVEEPQAQSGWLRQGLAEMIGTQLGQSPGVRLVARHRLAAALADARYDEQRGPAGDAASRVARAVRAERLVTGSYVRVDDRFVLNAQVVHVASGRTETAASVRGRYPVDLLDAVDEICLRLAPHVRPSPEPPAPGWRPAPLATRSVEASRHYVEALALFARGGRQAAEQAEARLDEALRLDPSFAQAYLKKAEIQYWRGRWGYGAPEPAPAVRAAAALVKELPERDRLLVRGFEALLVRQQPGLALQSFEALLKQYPTYGEELGVPGLMAETDLLLGRWDRIIAVAEAHVDSPSLADAERARLATLFAQALKRRGEYERALREAQRAVRLWPLREGPAFLRQRTVYGRLALDAGRRTDALAEFEAIAAAPQADATNLTDAGWGFYMAGEPDRARTLVGRALALDGEYCNAHHLRGWLALAQGQWREAAEALERAFERTPRSFGNPYQGVAGADLAALYYAAVARQKLGETRAAAKSFGRLAETCRKVLDQATSEDVAARWQARSFLARAAARQKAPVTEPPRLEGDDATYFVQTARLHALQGRREHALRELAQGLSLGHGEWRHIADDPDFETLRDDAEFRRLVTPQGSRTAMGPSGKS